MELGLFLSGLSHWSAGLAYDNNSLLIISRMDLLSS